MTEKNMQKPLERVHSKAANKATKLKVMIKNESFFANNNKLKGGPFKEIEF